MNDKEDKFDQLLWVTCVKYGCCGCPKGNSFLHVTMLIPSEGLVSADNFADWALLADDVNPNSEDKSGSREGIRAAFIEIMGSEWVDAKLLRYSHNRT
jgi:hypothetical protein